MAPLGGPPKPPPSLQAKPQQNPSVSLLRSLPMQQTSPRRRLRATVDVTASNAVYRLILRCDEAIPQLRFSPPALHVSRAVRVAENRVLFGHPLRLKEGSPGSASRPYPANVLTMPIGIRPTRRASPPSRSFCTPTLTSSRRWYARHQLADAARGQPRSASKVRKRCLL